MHPTIEDTVEDVRNIQLALWELHKLLTDLPDDMLEDSRDSSSPELDCSPRSNPDTRNRSQQPTWNHQQTEWSDHQTPASHEENNEEYDHGSYHEYPYEEVAGVGQINSHANHASVPQQGHPPIPQPKAWNQRGLTEYQHEHQHYSHGEGYTYTSVGTEQSAAAGPDFSTEEAGYGDELYPRGAVLPGVEYQVVGGGQRDEESYAGGDQNNTRKHVQNFDSGGSGDHYKASYNPYQPASQTKMFNSEVPHQHLDDHYDQLQRDFLDSAQSTADAQQLAQLQILNKAHLRQIEDLEQKLEDSRRNMRYLEHQFAIVRDEKEGLVVSLTESNRVTEEAKEREVLLQTSVKSLELRVQALTDRDHENTKKQHVAEAAVDSMQQQMMELCRSDSLSRAREQHDRDLTVVREQHDAKLLVLQQRLDACTQALEEQAEVVQCLRDQVRQQARRREEEQVERAGVINTLTQHLEKSQQQCAKLLQTGSVQEMGQLQMKLQQTQSAKTRSDNMNKALQEELSELKEQICLYESAVKHGVISVEVNGGDLWEKQLSDSYVDLGIKKTNWKNGRLHSTPLVEVSEPNPKLPREKEEGAVRELRAELQRCLASLKGKRQRISQLQDQLWDSQGRVDQLQTQLDQDQTSNTAETRPMDTHPDVASQKELSRLQEDRQRLQERLETLEKRNVELKQSEEKVKGANSELCTKMREMIQELDQEKQEAAQRYERTQQQFRDDVVNRVRSELALEHTAQMDDITADHQLQIQQLQAKLCEANGEMVAVQECYISLCKEKDRLEENLQGRMEEEEERRQKELKTLEESRAAMEKLRSDLESQHQETVTKLRALWAEEKDEEVRQQVQTQLTKAKATWREEKEKTERYWAQRLEAAVADARRPRPTDTQESSSQTDLTAEEKACQTSSPEKTKAAPGCSMEELDTRLREQRLQLQREADTARRRAVEDAGKRVQKELQEKHLEDMAKQVEGAVTRGHSRWLQDLPSLPEYKAALQRERENWESEQEQHVQQQVSLALRAAEGRWQEERLRSSEEEEQGGAGGDQRVEELQEEVQRWRQLEEDLKTEVEEVAHLQSQVDDLQSQLGREREDKAALLEAELLAARASWSRDKQQEISSLQIFQEEQLKQARKEANGELERQRKELLLQKEAELQQALRDREEDWKSQEERRGQVERRQGREEAREEVLQELKAGLKEVQAVLLRGGAHKEKENRGEVEGRRRASGSVGELLMSTCKDLLLKAVAQAKKEWKKISEERLGRVLKETQERHEKELNQIHSSTAQTREEGGCGKRCAETVTKLQKQSQDLQRHLEKACRQLQTTVKDHKASMQFLKDEHEVTLRKEKEDNLQKLEELKRSAAKESSGSSDMERSLHVGLEEMREQYMKAVEKIRGDMLRYLQQSKERAAEMIRVEVLRERRDTARKMRRYYLACLQELLEDGGQATGAEKKIINAASKLAAMAKVLETPTKRKRGKSHSFLGSSSKSEAATDNHPGNASGSTSSKTQSPASLLPETTRSSGGEGRILKTKMYSDPDSNTSSAAVKTTWTTRPVSKPTHQDPLTNGKEKGAPANTAGKPHVSSGLFLSLPPHKTSHQIGQTSLDCSIGDFTNITVRTQTSRELYLQGAESGRSDDDNFLCHRSNTKPFLVQEELPVRDEGGSSDWSLSSNGSQDGRHVLAVSSYPGRKMETVKPFSLRGPSSTDDLGDFGRLTTDNSDMTVYKEIVNVQSCAKASTFPSVPPPTKAVTRSVPSVKTGSGRSSHREPVPDSEGDRKNPNRFQNRRCSKSLFSELKRSQQQDNSFDGPFSHQK
ncbi:centrosomal protein of 152 kDa isoform X2 [Coregonus clupeaformis]|uniref:centrosomal protein of 152 kDa isoform X2 n=1 Tax=Coregonus clupeaformis TaxID=59861 RepID=UPI001E1C6E56|nr:centrosomal protein of 152 kDa isoform X2 [Coregonus clupeaformis]